MKTKIALLVGIFGFFMTALTACYNSDREKEATLIINLGATRIQVALDTWPPSNADLSKLDYEVKLSGTSEITKKVSGDSGSIILSVIPGDYVITVTAYSDDVLYAQGITSASIRSGQNNVPITMRRAGIYEIKVAVLPDEKYMQKGERFTFGAKSFYGPAFIEVYDEYKWSVSGNKSNETKINDATGELTVASSELADALTVTAESKTYSSKYGIATVVVNSTVISWIGVDGTTNTFGATSINGITWGGPKGSEKFVAVGDGEKIASSEDNINWVGGTISAGGHNVYSIAYGNNMFYAVGYGWCSSTDLSSWNAWAGSAYTLYCIAWDGTNFIAGANNGSISIPNLSSTGNSTGIPSPIKSIVWGGAAGVEKFIVGGANGEMAWSATGLPTWTLVASSAFGGSAINGIAYGNGMFVAVGADGKMAYSTDGTSWTAITPGTANGTTATFDTSSINGIAYGNGMFVAVGDDGKTAYSTDGISWTSVPNSTFGTSAIYGIAYGNGKFVTVGANGKMAYSE